MLCVGKLKKLLKLWYASGRLAQT